MNVDVTYFTKVIGMAGKKPDSSGTENALSSFLDPNCFLQIGSDLDNHSKCKGYDAYIV